MAVARPTPDKSPAATAAAATYHEASFEWHGAILGVRANDRTLLDAVRGAMPPSVRTCAAAEHDARYTWRVAPSAAAGGGARHIVTVRCGSSPRAETVVRTTCGDTAASMLVHDAEFRAAIHTRDDVFIHAAVVAWNDRAIVIPGHSHAGKSTLTAALVRAGALYFSDEYAVLGRDGLVHPFPRRLHMRSPSGGPSTDVPVESLGGVCGTAPLPLGRVLSVSYRRGARWRTTPMTRGEMALAMFDNTIVARLRPELALDRIAQLVGPHVIGLRGERGEADAAARRVLDWAS